MSTKILNPKDNRCANCEKAVFFNEKVIALNKTWHRDCFKCTDCNKRLALGSQLENKKNPYCVTCYQKNFGARGFRGGSSGSLVQGNYGGKTPVISPAEAWRSSRSLKISNLDALGTLDSSTKLPTLTSVDVPLQPKKSFNNNLEFLNTVSKSSNFEPAVKTKKSFDSFNGVKRPSYVKAVEPVIKSKPSFSSFEPSKKLTVLDNFEDIISGKKPSFTEVKSSNGIKAMEKVKELPPPAEAELNDSEEQEENVSMDDEDHKLVIEETNGRKVVRVGSQNLSKSSLEIVPEVKRAQTLQLDELEKEDQKENDKKEEEENFWDKLENNETYKYLRNSVSSFRNSWFGTGTSGTNKKDEN